MSSFILCSSSFSSNWRRLFVPEKQLKKWTAFVALSAFFLLNWISPLTIYLLQLIFNNIHKWRVSPTSVETETFFSWTPIQMMKLAIAIQPLLFPSFQLKMEKKVKSDNSCLQTEPHQCFCQVLISSPCFTSFSNSGVFICHRVSFISSVEASVSENRVKRLFFPQQL